MMNKKVTMLLIILLVIAVFASIAFIQKDSKGEADVKAMNTLEEAYNEVSKMGEDTAPVHIVEFGDYKCPFCKKFHEEFLPFVAQEYVAKGKAQFHFINFAFIGTDSTYMAEFAETVRQELGDDKYWVFHELVYQNQQSESDIWGTEENMTILLKSFTNEEQVKQVLEAVKDGKYKDAVKEQNKLASKLKVQGTPAIFINGELAQYNSYEELHKLIEDAVNEKQ